MDINLLNKILLSDNPSLGIKSNELDVFFLIPELEKCKGFEQNNEWHVYDVYNHIMKVIDGVPKDIRLRLAALFHDIGKPEVYTIDENGVGHFYNHWTKSMEIFINFAKKHSIDLNLTKIVSNLIYCHDMNFKKMNDKNIESITNIFSEEEFKLLFELKRADLLAQNPKYHDLLDSYELQEKMVLLKYKERKEIDERQ